MTSKAGTDGRMTALGTVECFAVSNKHKAGINVKIVEVGFYLLAIDITLSCGHIIRLNNEPSEPRFEFIEPAPPAEGQERGR